MRNEEQIREKVAECVANLRDLTAKVEFGGQDFIVADRNVTTLSVLLWALEEAPPDEVKKLADSVLSKFRQAS
ncbi:MAG: hypothetical protein V2A77_08700 [Pseudomonadota bacterium]